MKRTRSACRAALAAVVILASSASSWGDGVLQGHARHPKVTGRDAGWVELYEYYVNVCPNGSGTGQRYRSGSPPGQFPVGDGSYEFDLPAGTWSLLSSQPKFYPRGRVVHGITVTDGQVTTAHAVSPNDYSVAFGQNMGEWGTDPWQWGHVFAQTFVATGTSITRASYKLAGKDSGAFAIEVSIHDGGPDGPAIGPTRLANAGILGDSPVAWRSGEVPTVPGRTYAVRFEASGGQGFAFLRRLDSGDGYADGTAYIDGAPIGADLYAYVGSDNDGTVIPYCKIQGIGNLPMGGEGWWSGEWAQTFRATGTSLAAVDAFVANNDQYVNITWEIRMRHPAGRVVGPIKTVQAQYQASGVQHAGVVYSPDEVPLVPGDTYCIRCTTPPGMSFLILEPGESYADGQAYKGGSAVPSEDLYMTIYEYAAVATPAGIEGTVTDPGGAPVYNASVRIAPTGDVVRTDEDGRYESPPLPTGTYSLLVDKPGHAIVERPGLALEEAEVLVEDFELPVARYPTAVSMTNRGFETGDLSGWNKWGDVDGVHGPDPFFGGVTAAEGDHFAGSAANWGMKSGGVWQQVVVTPGYRYELSALYYLDWTDKPEGARKPDVRVAVDPTGGTDILGPDVLVSPWGTTGYAWTPAAVEFEPTGADPVATIFVEMRQRDPQGWNITCIDDVQLTAIGFLDGDGDGMSDEYESLRPAILHPGDPDDRDEDPDGDGSTNFEESRAGTDPEDGNSVFRVTRIEHVPAGVELQWTGVAPFRIWEKAGTPSAWSPLIDDHGDNTCVVPGGQHNHWYRIEPVR